MDNELVIAIDPGDKYVGIFVYNKGKVDFTQLTLSGDNVNQISQVCNCLDTILKLYHNDYKTLIVENFVNYTHKNYIKGFKPNLTSEMIGYLKSYAVKNDLKYVLQLASQAKVFSNDRLVRLNLLQESSGNYYLNGIKIPKHTRDAYRHFIYYANKHWFNNCINQNKLYKNNWCILCGETLDNNLAIYCKKCS